MTDTPGWWRPRPRPRPPRPQPEAGGGRCTCGGQLHGSDGTAHCTTPGDHQ